MRIAMTGDFGSPGLLYRAVDPLMEMERRGHTIVWPTGENGEHQTSELTGCDAVHVFRSSDRATWRILQGLASQGVAVTWDSDDDSSAFSEELPAHVAIGRERLDTVFSDSVATARAARIATFPSARLADVYRARGVEHARVIDSAVRSGYIPRRGHGDRILIGWVAADGHAVDFERLRLRDTLLRLQAAHPEVHVEAIGVDLGLDGRYRHIPSAPFPDLPRLISRFDIAIAPLSDIAYNHGRSDIKIKEYAAAGVPWLASPLTPYRAHAAGHGGHLVEDDAWFERLDDLVRRPAERARLGAEGVAWGRTQRIAAYGDQWEAIFEEAVAMSRAASRR